MFKEEPKRLAPTSNTLRELFLKSGNMCAYPGCDHLMMDSDGNFIGQICHIEAAEKGGQRFNSKMTNEERRGYKNLLLMCHAHHKTTDNVASYSAERLKEIKASHERKYHSPEMIMLASIRDWTQSNTASYPKNLRKLTDFTGDAYSQDEINEIVIDVGKMIDKYKKIPVEIRVFFSAALSRIQYVSDTNAVVDMRGSERAIHVSDLERALRISWQDLMAYADSLRRYGIASIEDIGDEYYRATHVFAVHEVEDFPFWSGVADYCVANGQDISVYAVEMLFDGLDH